MAAPVDRIVLKIIILGQSNVGKTSMMKRYTTDKFSDTRKVTVGADFMTKKIKVNENDVILQIWDTAGQERFHQGTIGQSFYRGANGGILVYDVTNESSFEQIIAWRDEALSRVDPGYYFPLVVVGNKVDLRNETNRIDQTPILQWCRDNTYGHIETSAKDGTGIQAAMHSIALLAIESKSNNTKNKNINPGIHLEGKYSTTKRGNCSSCN